MPGVRRIGGAVRVRERYVEFHDAADRALEVVPRREHAVLLRLLEVVVLLDDPAGPEGTAAVLVIDREPRHRRVEGPPARVHVAAHLLDLGRARAIRADAGLDLRDRNGIPARLRGGDQLDLHRPSAEAQGRIVPLTQLTGIVLFFVIVAGVYLGVLDQIFSKIIQAIL